VKRKSIFFVILIFIFLCFEFTQIVFGNGVPMNYSENPFFTVPLLIIMFFLGSWLEYIYFDLILFREFRFSQYRFFLRINLVTFPLTQILAYFFYIYFVQFFWIYVLFIEIGVVFTESYLLRIVLKRVVDAEISSKILLINTFSANIISFLVGLLAYLPIFIISTLGPI
jgi:hypothetical protein